MGWVIILWTLVLAMAAKFDGSLERERNRECEWGELGHRLEEKGFRLFGVFSFS